LFPTKLLLDRGKLFGRVGTRLIPGYTENRSLIRSFLPLFVSNSAIDGCGEDGEPRSKRNQYLYLVLLFAVFTGLSFFCCWNLQFGSQDLRLLLLLLILGFFGVMYSTIQLLDISTQQANLACYPVSNRYESSGDDVHKIAVTGPWLSSLRHLRVGVGNIKRHCF